MSWPDVSTPNLTIVKIKMSFHLETTTETNLVQRRGIDLQNYRCAFVTLDHKAFVVAPLRLRLDWFTRWGLHPGGEGT